MFWHDHKDFQSPWARNVLHQLSLEWRRSQAKAEAFRVEGPSANGAAGFPQITFPRVIRVAAERCDKPISDEQCPAGLVHF